MNTKCKTRALAMALACSIFIVLLFSNVFLAEHVHHDCTGEDCPVCAVMEQCINNLKTISEVVFFVAASLFFLHIITKTVSKNITEPVAFSLFSQKVRLND